MNVKQSPSLKELARQVEELAQKVESLGGTGRGPGSADTLALARSELRARRDRERFLPRDLFGEPAWDILIDLYIHHLEGKQVSITSACQAAACPPTSAIRYIDVLAQCGLVIRVPSATDRRTTHLELSGTALRDVTKYFEHRRKSGEPTAFPQLATSAPGRKS